MTEHWVDIYEFPGYAISDHGRVINTETELIKTPTPNQQGIPSVNLSKGRIQHRRSVAVLVANAFLEPPKNPDRFDTPINLDGNRENNHVSNLMWRPRWFAIRYHQQMKNPVLYGFKGRIEDVDTGVVYDDVRTLVKQFGLLEKEVIYAAHNHTPVFPTWQNFQLVLL